MSLELAKAHLEKFGLAEKIKEFSVSSATVTLAAEALHTEPRRIAKTLSFSQGERTVLIVAAGDAKVDNRKYKDRFGVKAKMLSPAEVEERTGHAIGGVCPFGNPIGVSVYLDTSLKRFETVFPAVGTAASAIELTIPELEHASLSLGWVDVTSLPNAE